MKILLVAPLDRPALGIACRDAFTEMGHTVIPFDYRIRTRRNSFKKKILDRIDPGHLLIQMNEELLQLAQQEKPEFILVFKGELIFPETWLQIRKKTTARMAIWHHDNPYNVLCSSAHLIYSAPLFHHTFIFDPYYIPELHRLGATEVTYLPPFSMPYLFAPTEITAADHERFDSPVTFLGDAGGFNSSRRTQLREVADLGLRIWGTNWHPKPYEPFGLNLAYWGDIACPELSERCTGPIALRADLVRAYKCSKIAINFLPFQAIEGLNLRTFEIPPTGTLMLCEESLMLHKAFKVGEEVESFRDAAELRKKTEYYLTHEQERQAIGERGRLRCLKDHTAQHRMQTMLTTIFP